MLPADPEDPEDELDLDDETTDDEAAADALLADMRRLTREVAAAVNAVDERSADAETAAERMHSRLAASLGDMVREVEHGDETDIRADADTEALVAEPSASSVAIAAGAATPEAEWQVPQSPPPHQTSPGGTGRGRFQAVAAQPAPHSVVKDISRLASKPLLPDGPTHAPARRGGTTRGAASGGRHGSGRGITGMR